MTRCSCCEARAATRRCVDCGREVCDECVKADSDNCWCDRSCAQFEREWAAKRRRKTAKVTT